MSLLVAIVLGVLALVVLLKLTLGIVALALGLAIAVLGYFAAETLIGKGER